MIENVHKDIKFKKHPNIKAAKLGVLNTDKFDFYIAFKIRKFDGKNFIHDWVNTEGIRECESSHDYKDGKLVDKKYQLTVFNKNFDMPLFREGLDENELKEMINKFSDEKKYNKLQEKIKKETFEILEIEEL
tara:strand:+ start:461 stop:856 length:396 start_codon:yes stop_codon:yes gene_type:complete